MIAEETVSQVAELVRSEGFMPTLEQELRERFPATRFTLCSEDDIHAGKPVMAEEGFAIYLVGSGEHCLTLTNDFSIATAVVVAERYSDDD